MEEKILEILRREGKPIAPETLLDSFEDKDAAAAAIESMLGDARIMLTRKRKLALPEQTGLVYGRIQGNARGYAFFIPEDGSSDMFIPADAMHGAMHGDKVWARPTEQKSRNGSDEAEVALIVIRANKNIVGTFESEKDSLLGGYVIPDDVKLYMDVVIPANGTVGAKHGDKVVARITDYPDGRRPLAGEITEIIGGKNEVGTDILSIIRRLEIPEAFSKASIKLAKSFNRPLESDDIVKREDMRSVVTITIDGADAKDLDDAVSLTKLKNGYLLGVHIADVSNYVTENSPLDKDAYKRGTSVYFPDRVIPMLPTDISNGICSLNSGTDKLTLSCIMEISDDGKVTSSRVAETVINTAHRMTYDDVNAIFDGKKELCEKYADIVPMLNDMRVLMELLNAQRVKRGSIDFDLAEAKILLDDKGKPTDICEAQRGVANRMIEEFMLITNETVARFARDLSMPFMYRVHETPDKDKLHDLNLFLNTMGYSLKNITNVHPKMIQKILDSARGTKEENIISRVTLRSMRKARYADECLGHFGLASECYCHFTSPIRRYPDLMVHRILKEILHGTMTKKRIEKYAATLGEKAKHCSDREIAAVEAERAADDLKKCEYMRDKVGLIETGIISGVAQYGFFVQLSSTVEGMVRAASIDDDYYYCDEKNYRMVGRNSGRVLRLGDEVEIKVASVDMDARTIAFELCAVKNQTVIQRQSVKKKPDAYSSRTNKYAEKGTYKKKTTQATQNKAGKVQTKPMQASKADKNDGVLNVPTSELTQTKQNNAPKKGMEHKRKKVKRSNAKRPPKLQIDEKDDNIK